MESEGRGNRTGVVSFFIRTLPPKDGRIPTLKDLAAPFEEKNPKGLFFGGTFVKIFRRVNFFAAPLI